MKPSPVTTLGRRKAWISHQVGRVLKKYQYLSPFLTLHAFLLPGTKYSYEPPSLGAFLLVLEVHNGHRHYPRDTFGKTALLPRQNRTSKWTPKTHSRNTLLRWHYHVTRPIWFRKLSREDVLFCRDEDTAK